MTKTFAVYRILYGEDFIQESIRSILPYVDRVFCVLAPKPWGNTDGVTYKGVWVPWPQKFDSVREKILELQEPKVTILDDYWPTPKNQLTHIVNDLILPVWKEPGDYVDVVFIEPDHVFSEEEADWAFTDWYLYSGVTAYTGQVELWKTPVYRIPERPNRTSVVFHRLLGGVMPETNFSGVSRTVHKLKAVVHNLGFCASDQVMYWKHLTALAFSKVVGDDMPNEDWLDDTWRAWDYRINNENLEIARGYEWMIPRADPHDLSELPESIKTRYNLGSL